MSAARAATAKAARAAGPRAVPGAVTTLLPHRVVGVVALMLGMVDSVPRELTCSREAQVVAVAVAAAVPAAAAEPAPSAPARLSPAMSALDAQRRRRVEICQ